MCYSINTMIIQVSKNSMFSLIVSYVGQTVFIDEIRAGLHVSYGRPA